jgi:5-methyltetrahydrofolate--homocysteine methyltransferase
MASVKGDVHDIGKNIVGVVLGCNNYEVIDLGVMVPVAKILATAREVGADVIGLSGLITPSLEEMRHVAGEMEHEGFTIPLLIGGATTSRVHTAVKIEPAYSGAVVHVADASRAVGVVGALLGDERDAFAAGVRAEYETVRRERGTRRAREARVSIEEARANALRPDLAVPVPVPTFTGVRAFVDHPLADLVPRIDWTPFFTTWELKGHYPEILDDARVGAQARSLHADAEALLGELATDGRLRASAVVGFWPANAVGDDIELYTSPDRAGLVAILRTLRQQQQKPPGRPNIAAADFVAPRESGILDYVGAFAVTAGHGVVEAAAAYEAAHDDYHAILVKALADRLAEAFAERLHEMVRRELWGYAPDEALSNVDLVAERYQGIRPAPGYPALPDHTEKATLFALLEAPACAGITLTESMAMLPAASVSGIYLWRPEAAYFGIGRIGPDQLEDYARRKGRPLAEMARWLAPNLDD